MTDRAHWHEPTWTDRHTSLTTPRKDVLMPVQTPIEATQPIAPRQTSHTMNNPTISIHGLSVPKPAPRYRAGHICTPAEAEILNAVLLERVKNNLTRRAKDKTLTEVEFLEYYNSYSLGVGPKEDNPIETESLKIARALLGEILNKDGKSIRDLPKDELQSKLAAIAQRQEIRDEAARRIATLNEVAMDFLESIR